MTPPVPLTRKRRAAGLAFIELIITIVIVAVVVMVAVWLLRYIGAPAILEKVVIVLAVLGLLVYGLRLWQGRSKDGTP